MVLRFFLFLFLLFSITNANQQTQKVSLQLLWKHQFEFAGFYMAKEKGYYKEVGLEVELKEHDFHTNTVLDVENGKTTYGIGYPNIILDKSNGAKINLISATLQSSPHVLITLNSSNIKSIEDFKNKKIMIEDNAIKTAPLLSLLYSHNVNFEDITIVPPSFNINDLVNKKVDIYSAFISNEVYKLKEQNINYDIWDPKDYGFDFYNDILFTSSTELKQNPKRVESFKKASLKGWEYAFNNIEETIEVIQKKYNSQNRTKDALLYEANQLKKLAYLNGNKLGDISHSKIQRIIDIYNLMGLVNKQIDLDEFIYNPKQKTIQLTEEEKAFLKQNNTIKVHNETYWPPFNYYENDSAKGYSIDYMNLLASKLNLNVEYINGPTWAEFLDMMKNNQLDVMLNIVQNEQRDKYLTFTTPYKKHMESLFSNNKKIRSLKDLNGKSIALTKEYFTENFIKKHYPKIKIHTYNNTLECIYAVIEGKSDALIESFPVVDYLLKKHNLSLTNVIINIDKRLEFDLKLAVSKNNPLLGTILQKAINSLSEEEINNFNNKWLGFKKFTIKGQSVDLTPKEEEYLSNNKITMCIDPNWMPFEKLEKDKHVGISADYFKLFESNLGKKIDIIPTKTWSESLEFAKQRKCDLLSLVMETPKRKNFMDFTTPYLTVPLVIATKIDVTFINNLNSLEGKPIGIPKGYAFVEILKTKYPFLNIIEVDNLDKGLEQVKNGTLFGYIGTLASVGYMFQTKYTGELKIAGKFDETWELGIGVRNDRKILLDIMEKTVQSINKTEQQSILNNWLAIQYEQKVDYRFLWQTLAVISIILLFFIYRQYLLKKNNEILKLAVENKTKELMDLNKSLEVRIEEAIKENSQKDRMLFAQSKMAAMGEMIGNIAHQWRQPLSVISTAASGIKLKIEMDIFNKEEEIENLDKLTDATKYLSNTIDDFKNFLHPSKEKKEFNIKFTLEKNLNMFGEGFKNNNIQFILNIQDAVIYGNENELLQVIINIMNNSKDALIEKKIEEKYIFIDLKQTQEYIIITFKDNAKGIPEEILHKIFDAYFTTKHKSMGTGIGLYMSYQIIQNSFNGKLVATNRNFTYQNKQHTGAQFQIILPCK